MGENGAGEGGGGLWRRGYSFQIKGVGDPKGNGKNEKFLKLLSVNPSENDPTLRKAPKSLFSFDFCPDIKVFIRHSHFPTVFLSFVLSLFRSTQHDQFHTP